MDISQSSVEVRPTRGVRLIEQGGVIVAYPEPHCTPVLPAGWAPLSREQQDAVLDACDAAPDSLACRLGSLWEPGAEYRVYRLANELWGGISVAAKCVEKDGSSAETAPRRQLLGLAWDTLRALRIAVDFFNWDLEAHGQSWRLDVTTSDERQRSSGAGQPRTR